MGRKARNSDAVHVTFVVPKFVAEAVADFAKDEGCNRAEGFRRLVVKGWLGLPRKDSRETLARAFREALRP